MHPLNLISHLTLIATLLFFTACADEVTTPTSKITTTDKSVQTAQTTDLSDGQKIYEKSCAYCHTTGTLNAPVLGNKRAWDETKQEGLEHLVSNVIFGIGEMEPKGGAHKLSDEEIKMAVKYIVKTSEE